MSNIAPLNLLHPSLETMDLPPEIVTEIPGPKSIEYISSLAETECPAITARRQRRHEATGADQDPIVWAKGKGALIWDVDNNRYVDFTSAFGVSGLGHGHPDVVAAGHTQLDHLIHGMGDVYPTDAKILFAKALAKSVPEPLQQSILGLSGSDGVVAALKTAVIHTGKPGVIAFSGSYHGLSYGSLSVTGYKKAFRTPFLSQLNRLVSFHPYPNLHRDPFGQLRQNPDPQAILEHSLNSIRFQLEHPAAGGEAIGAIIVEPIQGRGGEVVPPPGFLKGLRELCDSHDMLLIYDEIFTGFCRTGYRFALESEGVVPDLLCLGKGLGGGFPLSAVVGSPQVMGSWGLSNGEAIHTQTFLGNPLGCRMGLAALDILTQPDTLTQVNTQGAFLTQELNALKEDFPHLIGAVCGRGLMLGLDFMHPDKSPNWQLCLQLMDKMRAQGYLVLPSGIYGNILSFTPPFVISNSQIEGMISTLRSILSAI